jgi:hypothetical protein
MFHGGFSQSLENRHDPKIDFNLSPTFNSTLNPEKNSNINPKYNWNINPMHNNDVNPEFNSTINPLNHFELNPDINKTLNPMYHNEYHPKNPSWKGLYIFNKTDELIGYVSIATQQLMLTFDIQGEWTGFLTKAAPGRVSISNKRKSFTNPGNHLGGIYIFHAFKMA